MLASRAMAWKKSSWCDSILGQWLSRYTIPRECECDISTKELGQVPLRLSSLEQLGDFDDLSSDSA